MICWHGYINVSTNSMKQQCAGRPVASLVHIILTSSQPIFVLHLNAACLANKQTIQIWKSFIKDLNTQIHLLFNLTTGSAITEIKQTHEKCFQVLTASNEIPMDCFILSLPSSLNNDSNRIYIVSSIVLTYYQYIS